MLFGEGIGAEFCSAANVLMGPPHHLFFKLGIFGLFLCGGCCTLGALLVPGSKLFIAAAQPLTLTTCPTPLLMHSVLCFILVCPTFAACPTFAVHLALTTHFAFTMCFTFTTHLAFTVCPVLFHLPLITSFCHGATAFIFCLLICSSSVCLGMLPRGGILRARLWGVLVLLCCLSFSGDGCCLATVWSNCHWCCLSKSLTDSKTGTSCGGVSGVTCCTGMLAAILFCLVWSSTSLKSGSQ